LKLSLVVGLGNPDERYENTRHNLGFRVVDYLAKRIKQSFKPGKGEYLFCEFLKEGEKKVLLMKPLTYMNSSGQAVVDALDQFKLSRENLLVLCDDTNLPLGKIRIRDKGSDGGHKGLRSIIYHLDSISFARLRMGIGESPEDMDLEDFVLREFDSEEKEGVEKMLERACAAVEYALTWGLEYAASRFNS
jgi:PTH1 family peptidyl-tRNA hydrolase